MLIKNLECEISQYSIYHINVKEDVISNLLIINKLIMIITIDSLNNIILYRRIVNSNFDCKFCGNRLYFIENDNQLLVAEEWHG
ncbi:hypothetical protein ICY_04295 [Bacillus cereus BAG2X1-3]|nr:hypothetical protein ICY_04295 [Bacillus cereus BAG2X1-3]